MEQHTNANELADEIDKFLQEAEQLPWGTKQVYLDRSSTMLRQLQADNEELKADNDKLIEALNRANRVYDFDNPLLEKAQEK